MRTSGMTTRWCMAVVAGTAVGMWMITVAYRIQAETHDEFLYHLWVLKDSPNEPRRSIMGTLCRAPFWPRYWRRLLGQPWPGSYTCRCDDPHYAINGGISQFYALVGSRTGPYYGDRLFPSSISSWESIEPWDLLIREYQRAREARPDP
jgi:hypothetical protein